MLNEKQRPPSVIIGANLVSCFLSTSHKSGDTPRISLTDVACRQKKLKQRKTHVFLHSIIKNSKPSESTR
jgi:hypothetical protein